MPYRVIVALDKAEGRKGLEGQPFPNIVQVRSSALGRLRSAGFQPRCRSHPELPAGSWDTAGAGTAHLGTGKRRNVLYSLLYLPKITSFAWYLEEG